MRPLLRLGAVLLAAAALAACGGGNGGGDGDIEGPLEEALRRMVLQPEELAEGLVQGGEAFTTNHDLASASADPEARKAVLESWGRLLSYDVSYQPGGAALGEGPVQGIQMSSSLFKTAEGARESFAEAVKTSEQTDWAANYADLIDFQLESIDARDLADETVWLRFSGFQPTTDGPSALVTDDLIFFRVDRERGFLRILARSTEAENRQYYESTVEGWLRTLIKNVKDVLAERGFEVGGE